MRVEEFAKTLKVGERCNVRFNIESEKLIRVVTKVVTKKQNGKDYLYWFWEKESMIDGKPDCGYSGIEIDWHNKNA